MAVSISICNMALGELRAKSIADINEQSLEAATCARYYPQALSTLLELHDWSFATKIASLALLYTNPRVDEWPFAYGLPADFSSVKRVLPGALVTGSPYYSPSAPRLSAPFVIEAGVLYTAEEDARLEYSASDLSEASMTALFKEALYLSLAFRIAIPIANDRTLKGDLFKQHELAAQRAIADDRNRQPQQEVQSDDVGMARRGGSDCWGGSNGSVYAPGGEAFLGDGDQYLVEG